MCVCCLWRSEESINPTPLIWNWSYHGCEQVLGIKTVLMGFGLESDAIHSPNENFSLDIFHKGIEAVVEFHKEYARM